MLVKSAHRPPPSGCCATPGCNAGRLFRMEACARLGRLTLRKPAAHHHAHKRWLGCRSWPALKSDSLIRLDLRVLDRAVSHKDLKFAL